MKKFLISIFVFVFLFSRAQVGGIKVFRFLDIPMAARAAALGGNNMSIWGDDINLLYSNPALINPGMTRQVPFNYCNYVGDMNFFSTAYAHSLKEKGMVAASIQAFDYGNFKGYDELGNETSPFKANDYSINLNYGKAIGADSSFNAGVCLKTIISQYDIYKSFGNAIDVGITYHTKKNFVVSLVAKNVGFIWKSYTGQKMGSADLPRTVQLGTSYKPSNAPFKLFMVYDQLLRRNLSYISPIDTAGDNSFLSNSSQQDSTDWQRFKVKTGRRTDNFMRHIIFGAEIGLSKNFFVRVAYNYRRQKEMSLTEKRGANGLSFGVGIKIKRFALAYSFTKMAVPGNSSILGITFCW